MSRTEAKSKRNEGREGRDGRRGGRSYTHDMVEAIARAKTSVRCRKVSEARQSSQRQVQSGPRGKTYSRGRKVEVLNGQCCI
jgi:hypothetical protein